MIIDDEHDSLFIVKSYQQKFEAESKDAVPSIKATPELSMSRCVDGVTWIPLSAFLMRPHGVGFHPRQKIAMRTRLGRESAKLKESMHL